MKDLERMTRLLAHRGPDGEALRVDSPVYLGHRRLAVIDPEGGRQPMSTPDGRYSIVFNGEIYNFLELRNELIQKGYRFSSDHSDTETLLIGFANAREKIFDRLNGMWSCVIYDRAEGLLVGARDRFGKKPLYYYHQGRHFGFASELTSLLQHPKAPKSVSQLSLQKYFAYGYIPSPRTIIEGISKLPGGFWFQFDIRSGELRLHRYWDYLPEPSNREKDAQALADELLVHLSQAVRRRLVSDVPLGVFLSGGIDSSSVAAIAKQKISELKTFTIGFQEASFDESQYAKRMAAELKTDHHVQYLSLEKSKEVLLSIVDRLDEPLGDSSLLPTFLLCRFAREQVTVALAGDGGDELFCGYDPFKVLRRADFYSKLMPKPAHFCVRLFASQLPVSMRNISFDFKLKRTLRGLSFPQKYWAPVWMGPLEPKDIRALFHTKISLEELYSEAIEVWDSCRHLDLVTRIQKFFIKLYLQDCVLTKVDRASMMNGLEVRCPYLDYDLVEFARKLPSHWKLRNGVTKWILKRALDRVLPRQILHRPKKGFGVPIARWFKDGSILELSEKRLTSARFRAGYFERKLYEHRMGIADHRLYLWNSWLLNQWLAK